jgi:putative CocE/NonD family hydrolase
MKTHAARSFLLILSIVLISSALVFLSQCHAGENHGKKTLMVPMRDGIELATDLYFPEEGAGPWPAVLVRTSYDKTAEKKYSGYFSRSGYVVAVQDVRGMFDSEGEFELWVNEREDGYDAVEWLAAQEWCTGKVGMIGGSYGGWVQLAAAVEKPPHLVTIVPKVTMADPFFNDVYPYGMFHLTQHLQALAIFESLGSRKGSGLSLDPDWKSQLDHLPAIDLDEKALGGRNKYWRRHIEHNTRDSYWERSSFLEKLESLDIPVFIQGGWFDFGGIGTKLSYLHLKASKNKHVKLIIGPWSHRLEGTGQVGGHNFGEQAEVDLLELSLGWFDFWLKGKDNGIVEEPLVQIFATGQNRWLKANTYPLPKTIFLRFYLTSEQGANTLDGDGRLQLSKPSSDSQSDSYVYDPGHPTPSLWFDAMGSYQMLVSSREDILVYQTEPLEESLMVAGPVSAKLYASSSAKDTDWVVYWRMADDSSGVQYPMGRGTLRARYRNSPSNPELLEKDSIYGYTIDLWHMGMFLPKGCRIRVEVTSACFPDFSRNLNTGGNNETETEYKTASQRIYHTEEYPSHLILPVVNLGDYE